jgi:hypothetical protein
MPDVERACADAGRQPAMSAAGQLVIDFEGVSTSA